MAKHTAKRFRVTFRDGSSRTIDKWSAVVKATRPGTIVERRTTEGWQAVEMLYGIAKKRGN